MSDLKELVLSQVKARKPIEESTADVSTESKAKPTLKLGGTKPTLSTPPTTESPTKEEPAKPAGLSFGTPKPAAPETTEPIKEFKSANELASPVLSAGESPATAPARDYPSELDAQQMTFVGDLDSLYEVFDDVPLVSQAIRSIVAEMQENPNYVDLVMDDDRHVMMKALMETLGLAQVKKAAKKRATKKKAAPRTTKALANLGDDQKSALDAAFAGLS